ncbi:MAG: DNA polymerase III subunit gamma/tau [Eubacterium sp.]|nr:DNA polymerase III subunit gamma/tau [Eubacterium sp.]
MGYTALYRKFRPQRFDEVRGQDAIVTTLKNQLKADRIGHAYLFCGTRGTGKTTIAKILARAVNCEHPTENGPCNACSTCQAILNGTSTNVIEIDAASNNGVDNIREIREEVAYRPTSGRFKVYIIDEVHMLSTGAFNALLKTLEEPPEYVMFILATTEANKIPVTILSRCQRYDFRRIAVETIADQIKSLLEQEKIESEPRAIRYIARKADGSMRDALSLLDQCIAFHLGEKLTFDRVLNVLGTIDTDVFSRLLRMIIARDAAGSIRILEELVQQGKEMGQFVSDFTWYLRNLMLLQSDSELEDVLDVSTENLAQLREESEMIEPAALMRYIRVLSELSGTLRQVTQRRVLVETTLIRLCRPEMNTNREAILQRIRNLEKQAETANFTAEESEFLHTLAANPGAVLAARGNGIAGMGGIAGGPGSGMYGADGAGSMAGTGAAGRSGAGVFPGGNATAPKPPRAAPEDLKRIRENWRRIVGQTGGLVRGFLSMAVPKYDPAADESKLFLCFTDPNAKLFFEDTPDNSEHREELQKAIQTVIGKQAAFEPVCETAGGRSHFAEILSEEELQQRINMPIETEEDDGPEDDFF